MNGFICRRVSCEALDGNTLTFVSFMVLFVILLRGTVNHHLSVVDDLMRHSVIVCDFIRHLDGLYKTIYYNFSQEKNARVKA